MKIGSMRERVAFNRASRVQRDDGGYSTTQIVLSTVWADVRPVQATEREQAGRLFGSTTYLVTIHADEKPSDLTTDDGVTWQTAPGGVAVEFNLRAIRQPPARPLTIELVCEAGAVL